MKQATTVLISNFSEKGENKEGIQSLLDQLTGHQVHVISCDFAKDEIALETRNWLTFHQNGVAAVYPVKSKKEGLAARKSSLKPWRQQEFVWKLWSITQKLKRRDAIWKEREVWC